MQHRRYGYFAAAAAAAALTLSACGSGTDTQTTPATSAATSSATTSSATSSTAAAEQAHNDADVTFAQGMIPHHQQAIEMSDMLLAKQGISPELSTLANEIKAAQSPEIDTMQGWLTQWGASTTTSMPSHDMPGHEMPGGGHGMMSEADMAALQNAQGAEASRLFLTQMIAHHNGAIMMAQQEIDDGQFPPAVEIARQMMSSQQAEITAMQAMLDAM